MPKLTATTENATAFQPLEKGIYTGHVTVQKAQDTKKLDANGQPAKMVALQFEVDEPSYNAGGELKSDPDIVGRQLPGMNNWYFIMVSGNKEGSTEPHDTRGLCEAVNALGATWECRECGMSSSRKLVKEKSSYLCPNCGRRIAFDFDSDTWPGLRCKLVVDTEKIKNSDDSRNVVKALRPLQ